MAEFEIAERNRVRSRNCAEEDSVENDVEKEEMINQMESDRWTEGS